MKKSLAVLLVFEFLLAIAMGQAGFVHRSGFDRAFMEWHLRPTTESREAFERQRRIIEIQRLGFSAVLFAVLAAGTGIVYHARKGEQVEPGNRRHASRIRAASVI